MKKTYSALTGLLLLSVAAISPANLIVNGSFESFNAGLANVNGGSYWTYNAGNVGITGWTVGDVSVDVTSSVYPVHSGSYALDLVGSPGPGSISQAVSLAADTYELSFWAKASPDDTMNVSFASLNSTLTNMSTTWTKYSFFVATSGVQTAKLKSFSSGNGNLFIDDVSLQAAPEPCSIGLLGLGVAGLVARRRNQTK